MGKAKYKLKDHGYPTFKKIMLNKNWIGRVAKHSKEPGYIGVIGTHYSRALTEQEAFDIVTAKHAAYTAAKKAADPSHNVMVVVKKRGSRKYAKYAVAEMIQGNFEPVGVILGMQPKRRPESEAR